MSMSWEGVVRHSGFRSHGQSSHSYTHHIRHLVGGVKGAGVGEEFGGERPPDQGVGGGGGGDSIRTGVERDLRGTGAGAGKGAAGGGEHGGEGAEVGTT